MSGKTIQNCNYDEVKDLKLGNGEKLPLFEDILTELKKSKVTKLILEFKTHNTREKNNLVIDTALKMIDDAGLNDMVEYIAFDYENCKRIAAARPEAIIDAVVKGLGVLQAKRDAMVNKVEAPAEAAEDAKAIEAAEEAAEDAVTEEKKAGAVPPIFTMAEIKVNTMDFLKK
jgi:glycerophosphoryl diester phosphodiesterase